MQDKRILSISPWIFAAASFLLLIIISVFALNNYKREKTFRDLVLLKAGQAVLNIVASNTRIAVRSGMLRGGVISESWLEDLQNIIENSTAHTDVASIFIIDLQGNVLAATGVKAALDRVDENTRAWLNSDSFTRIKNYRTVQAAPSADKIFQIAQRYTPINRGREGPDPEIDRPWRMGPMRNLHRLEEAQRGAGQQPPPRLAFYLIAELPTEELNKAVQKQFVQIIILSLILLLVGVGGLLSILTLQGLKGTQSDLQRSNAFNEILISSMPLGIIASDQNGIIQSCNGSALQMLEINSFQPGSEQSNTLIPPQIMALIEAPRSLTHYDEISLPTVHGIKTISARTVPITGEAGIVRGRMLILQDLSLQKNLQKQLQRNERHTALGKMAAGVAHELRNPLSSIKGLAIILRSRLTEDTQATDSADLLISEVERLDRVIGELLEYARPEQIRRQTVEVEKIIRNAVLLIEGDAVTNGTEIITDIDKNGVTVSGDSDKLTQVFLNVMLNSLQEMHSGGRLVIRAAQNEEGGAHIRLSDSGAGIDPHNLEKVFDPYFTTKHDGTGLGLALTKKIVDEHGGTLEIEETNQHGTTVKITLPG